MINREKRIPLKIKNHIKIKNAYYDIRTQQLNKLRAWLEEKIWIFKQWVNNHAKEEYSPGFGTELVTDWGTFWLINSTQCQGRVPPKEEGSKRGF